MPDNQANRPDRMVGDGTSEPTPELVRQVTEKVYQLLLKDLKQENERRRIRNASYRR